MPVKMAKSERGTTAEVSSTVVVNRILARLLERLGVVVIRMASSEIWSAWESRKARKPETVANLAAIQVSLREECLTFCRQALDLSL